MPEERRTYTIEVENLTAAEADTILRMLHATGYPAVIKDSRAYVRTPHARD